MTSMLAKFWAIVFLLLGSQVSCLANESPIRENASSDLVVSTASAVGELAPFDTEPGKFHLPDGVIEECTEEEDNSDSQNQLGFAGPAPLVLVSSPALTAISTRIGTKAVLQELRMTCLRC
ncbi:MAG TPA: hypothetical protein VFT74_01750 [Isosphaeraceae bacterium]|nr:hypothetical protein [Isosphaeraceae bacterium]